MHVKYMSILLLPTLAFGASDGTHLRKFHSFLTKHDSNNVFAHCLKQKDTSSKESEGCDLVREAVIKASVQVHVHNKYSMVIFDKSVRHLSNYGQSLVTRSMKSGDESLLSKARDIGSLIGILNIFTDNTIYPFRSMTTEDRVRGVKEYKIDRILDDWKETARFEMQ